MKIDRSKVVKTSYPLPPKSELLIAYLKACSTDDQLQAALTSVHKWQHGYSDMYHWADVLDKFDSVFEECCKRVITPNDDVNNPLGELAIDLQENSKKKDLLLAIVHFTGLMVENTYGETIYSSQEYLTALLGSNDMKIVAAVMCLLYQFADQSSVSTKDNRTLQDRIRVLARNWGGTQCGVALGQCCSDVPLESFPQLVTMLDLDLSVDKENKQRSGDPRKHIRIAEAHLDKRSPLEVLRQLVAQHKIPIEDWYELFAKIRMIRSFTNFESRLQCVLVHIYAIAYLVKIQDSHVVFNKELAQEMMDVLAIESNSTLMMNIKTATLRAMSAIMLWEGNEFGQKAIVSATDINLYNGILPLLVRKVIHEVITSDGDPTLFQDTLIYLLLDIGCYQIGYEALAKSDLTAPLLQLIKWDGPTVSHLKIVTTAVAVIMKIARVDPTPYLRCNGLNVIARRFEREIDACRTMAPFVIDIDQNTRILKPSEETDPELVCLMRRRHFLHWALLHMKRCIQQTPMSDSLSQLMSGLDFSRALQHILSNSHFYTGPIFSNVLEFITSYTNQNPFYLSTMLDCGLFDVILHATLVKTFPCTKDVLSDLPSMFNVLCLNQRGMKTFTAKKPFDSIFKLFTSAKYLLDLRKHRGEVLGDAVAAMGNTMDGFIRHQINLRPDAIQAIIKVLEELRRLGQDPKYICSKISDSSILEVDFEDHTAETESPEIDVNFLLARLNSNLNPYEVDPKKTRTAIPLHHYIFLTTKFLNAWISASKNVNLCHEFIKANGLKIMLDLLKSPNLPLDTFVHCSGFYGIINLYDSLQCITWDSSVLKTSQERFYIEMDHLAERLDKVANYSSGTGSILLEDLVLCLESCSKANLPNLATLSMRSLAVVYCYVRFLQHSHSTDDSPQMILAEQWATPQGLKVINKLGQLYATLLWEKTLLDGLAELTVQPKCGSIQAQLEKAIQLVKKVMAPNEDEQKADSKKEDPSDLTVIRLKHVHPIVQMTSQFDSIFKKLLIHFVKFANMSSSWTFANGTEAKSPDLIAEAITSVLSSVLLYQVPPDTDNPWHRAKFHMSVMEITTSALFDVGIDDQAYPYHMMLLCFERSHLVEAFFAMFKQMVKESDLESGKLSVETLQFLDVWLKLLERMANPQLVMESTHIIGLGPDKTVRFDPKKYLISLHAKTYDSIQWLFKGKLLKQYNSSHITSLLTVMMHLFKFHTDATSFFVIKAKVNFLPEGKIPRFVSFFPGGRELTSDEATGKEVTVSNQQETLFSSTLSSLQMDTLAISAMHEIIPLVEFNAAMLAKCSDLLALIAKYNENEDHNQGIAGFLDNLVRKVTQNMQTLLDRTQVIPDQTEPAFKDWSTLLHSHPVAIKLNTRMRLFLALFTRMPSDSVLAVHKHRTMTTLLELLERAAYLYQHVPDESIIIPSWLCPVLLLIDQFERHVVAHQLRAQILASFPKRQWKILIEHDWKKFGATNQKKLDKAFVNGEPYCRYEFNSQRFAVHFGTMQAFCCKTSQLMPVTFIQDQLDPKDNQTLFLQHDQSENKSISYASDQMVPVESCIKSDLLESLVIFMKLSAIKPDTLEAIVRITLRATQSHSNACRFADLGGIHALLDLTMDRWFSGSFAMSMLLIRHVFENGPVLRHVMVDNIYWETKASYQERESQVMLRRYSPAAHRNVELFKDIFKTLKIEDNHFVAKECDNVPLTKEQLCKQSIELTTFLLNLLPKRFAYEVGSKTGDKEYLFDTSNLLRVLAELCRFCDPVIDIIFEHRYSAGTDADCTALHFILSNMLSVPSGAGPKLNEFHDSLCKVLCKMIIRADKGFSQRIFTQMVITLQEVLTSAESADKHRKIEGICTLFKTSVEYSLRIKDKPIMPSVILKFVETCGFLYYLALAYENLDLSSPSISISVNALLKAMLYLVTALYKLDDEEASTIVKQEQVPQIPAQPEAATTPAITATTTVPVAPMATTTPAVPATPVAPTTRTTLATRPDPLDDDDYEDALLSSPSLIPQEEEDSTNQNRNSTDNFQVCTLVHPMLLSDQSVISNPTNATLYFKSCQPLLNSEPLSRCPSVTLLSANSVVIFHGFNSQGVGCDYANRVVSCSMCRWYQESALIDGETMSYNVMVATLKIMKNWELENEEQPPTDTNDSIAKVTEASIGSTSNGPPQEEIKKNKESPLIAGPKQVEELVKDTQPVKEVTKEDQPKESTKVAEAVKEAEGTPQEEPTADAKSAASGALVADQPSGSKDAKEPGELPKEAQPVKEAPPVQPQLTPEQRAILGDGPLPEGLDPEILLQLPEDLRREVIQEHLQAQDQAKRQEQLKQAQTAATNTIDTATLANALNATAPIAAGTAETQALTPQPPPGIQQEQEAAGEAAQVATFLHLSPLPASLRRQILVEMDDSQLRFMPDDIVAEVRALRQEATRRIHQQEIARNAAEERVGGRIREEPRRVLQSISSQVTRVAVRPGRQLICQQPLKSLLALLFVQDSSIQRNLYNALMVALARHEFSRHWLAETMLDILDRVAECPTDPEALRKLTLMASSKHDVSRVGLPSITVKSTFGTKLKVFVFGNAEETEMFPFPPQAHDVIRGNVLALLLELSKSYSDLFFPSAEVLRQRQPASEPSSADAVASTSGKDEPSKMAESTSMPPKEPSTLAKEA